MVVLCCEWPGPPYTSTLLLLPRASGVTLVESQRCGDAVPCVPRRSPLTAHQASALPWGSHRRGCQPLGMQRRRIGRGSAVGPRAERGEGGGGGRGAEGRGAVEAHGKLLHPLGADEPAESTLLRPQQSAADIRVSVGLAAPAGSGQPNAWANCGGVALEFADSCKHITRHGRGYGLSHILTPSLPRLRTPT